MRSNIWSVVYIILNIVAVIRRIYISGKENQQFFRIYRLNIII